MDYAVRVRLCKRVGDLQPDVERLLNTETAAFDAPGERFAFDVVHCDERNFALVVDFVDCANVRVIQSRGGTGFAQEARGELTILPEFGGQDFQCNMTIQLQVFGQIDLTHSARAERRYNFVATEMCAGSDGHGIQATGWSSVNRGINLIHERRKSKALYLNSR